ncbi:hypothetical protein [Treponema sp.]|uniref:hypothetical protein n=1 Tax=Treponema sp. TaxID=166 RepID=UPI00298D952E|nr:hypothetical protein [Treponema sp.]MCQ2240738.1 hypothetical protein [Treponema sp.]
MKKITKLLFIAFAAASLSLAGCSMLGDATVSDSKSDNNPEVKLTTLKGRVSNLKDYDASVRSIIPEADDKSYDYYIMGKTITGKAFTDPDDSSKKYKQLTTTGADCIIKDNAEGIPEFTLPIETAAWELTLCAVPAGTTDINDTNMVSKAALVAYAFADLTKSTDAVMFTLSPDNLTGKGNIALTLYLSDDSQLGTKATNNLWQLPDGYTCEFQIQNLITGEVVKWSEASGPDAKDSITFVDPASGDDAYGKKSKAGPIGGGHELNPGTYNFVVLFKHASLPTSVWSDVLVVLPTKTTEQNVFIPNVLGKEPAKVSEFNGYIVNESWDLPQSPDYYIAHFEWDAYQTLTERYFEIQLGEIDSKSVLGSAVTTDELWTANVDDFRDYAAEGGDYNEGDVTKTRVELRKQDEYFDGSLFANNTRCSVYVPLGKVIVARIRAVNNVGNSAWTYVALPDAYSPIPVAAHDKKGGQAAGSTYSASLSNGTKAAVPFDTDNPAKVMNKFRITYNLNGGSRDTDGTKNKVEYGSQSDLSSRNVVKLWAANGSDVQLKKTPSVFNCWSTEAVATEASRVYRAVVKETPDDAAAGDYGCIKSTNGTGEDQTYKQTTKIADMKTVVTKDSNTDKTAAKIMEKDDGGYIGVGNLYLYADYSTAFNGDVTKEDATADFFLATDWVILRSSGSDPDKTVYNKDVPVICGTGKSKTSAADAMVDTISLMTVSKENEKTDDSGIPLRFSIALPCSTATAPMEYYVGTKKYTLDELCKTANVYLSIEDAHKVVYATSEKTLSGGSETFDAFNIVNWDNGRYTAYINMTVNKTGRPITRSVRITLDIVD